MKLQLNATGVLAVAGVAVAGFLAWKAYRAGQGIAEGVSDAWDASTAWLDQQRANIVQGFSNATGGLPVAGDPVRAALYSNDGYDGTAATSGEWFADEEARRYEYESQAEYARLRRAQPVVGPNGAAFGIYPRP